MMEVQFKIEWVDASINEQTNEGTDRGIGIQTNAGNRVHERE